MTDDEEKEDKDEEKKEEKPGDVRDKILARFVDDLWQSSERTRRSRAAVARRFLDFAGDPPWNRRTVIRFLKHLEKQGYAPMTRRTAYSVVKRVFDAAGLVIEDERSRLISSVDPGDPTAMAQLVKALAIQRPTWDMGKRAAPRVDAKDIVAPALEVEEIRAMVDSAREGKLGTDEAAFLALAVTFGLRREELCRIAPEHIDFSQKTVHILTCKGGDERTHLIPEQILPWLMEHDFSKVYGLWDLWRVYRQIEDKSGVAHRENAGWHSIRRPLDTLLREILPEPMVKSFMRWRMASSSDMTLRYYSKDTREVDLAVYKVHPFLQFFDGASQVTGETQ